MGICQVRQHSVTEIPQTQNTIMVLKAGKTFVIKDTKSGTALDLSGGQELSPITGSSFRGAGNQKVGFVALQ